MMIYLRNLVLFAFTLLLSIFSQAQEKYEKEYRIPQEELPDKALQFINSTAFDFSEKWYIEENLEGNSVEAKFKYHRKKYSVEFDTLGNLLDIEVEQSFDELPAKLQESIKQVLKDSYSKFTIRKMQVQYSDEIASFANFLEEPNKESRYNIHYELVVKGKKHGEWNLFEMTFKANGALEKTEQIILRNTDHLEF